MSKRAMFITVRGKHREWTFVVREDPRHLNEWRKDGLEIYEIHNMIPDWIAGAGLTRPWCFIQDIFHLRNPFERVGNSHD